MIFERSTMFSTLFRKVFFFYFDFSLSLSIVKDDTELIRKVCLRANISIKGMKYILASLENFLTQKMMILQLMAQLYKFLYDIYSKYLY